MEAYCVKCRAKREMSNAKAITMKNGKPATQVARLRYMAGSITRRAPSGLRLLPSIHPPESQEGRKGYREGKTKGDILERRHSPDRAATHLPEENGRRVRRILRIIAKLLPVPLLATLLLSLVACGPAEERPEIDFNETEPIPLADTGEESEPILRVAFAGVISPKETIRTYDALVQYIERQFHGPVQIVQRETYAEINDLVESLDVDLAFVCSLAYVVGNDDFGMELLTVPEVNGETTYRSYIIVPAASDIHSLDDLRGKTFAFSDPLSNSGRLAPVYRLYQLGETPETFFDRAFFTYSHDRSIRAVADGLVDGAAVDSLVYDFIIAHEPEIAAQTRIVETSEPFGIPPVIVHPDLDPEIKARLRELLLGLDEDAEGRQILDDLMIDRFVVGDDAAYDTIRNRVRDLGW